MLLLFDIVRMYLIQVLVKHDGLDTVNRDVTVCRVYLADAVYIQKTFCSLASD